jgi:hypothetical protein
MANTPNSSKLTEFAIAPIPPMTPLALSMKARSSFDVEATLPTQEELANFKAPTEAIAFMKERLLLAGVSTTLYKDAAKPPSYRDITSATEKHTSAFTASLAKTANLLLIVMQELCLHRTCNKVWTGATFLEKRVSDLDDPSQIEVTKIELLKTFHKVSVDLLKTFHKVSVATMIGLAKTFWADPDSTHIAHSNGWRESALHP